MAGLLVGKIKKTRVVHTLFDLLMTAEGSSTSRNPLRSWAVAVAVGVAVSASAYLAWRSVSSKLGGSVQDKELNKNKQSKTSSKGREKISENILRKDVEASIVVMESTGTLGPLEAQLLSTLLAIDSSLFSPETRLLAAKWLYVYLNCSSIVEGKGILSLDNLEESSEEVLTKAAAFLEFSPEVLSYAEYQKFVVIKKGISSLVQ